MTRRDSDFARHSPTSAQSAELRLGPLAMQTHVDPRQRSRKGFACRAAPAASCWNGVRASLRGLSLAIPRPHGCRTPTDRRAGADCTARSPPLRLLTCRFVQKGRRIWSPPPSPALRISAMRSRGVPSRTPRGDTRRARDAPRRAALPCCARSCPCCRS